ncbi:pVII [California sea lion adenovirus 1]|uniref:PVII n=1 Tax=California sea lion adenovirus 1 TaxID=943083 RepID=A0A059XN96_9ADEN|nr:pVII [California sea lion adenovirus 1]AIA22353.1 pVII [California sea lion adenovirus 1]
MSILISPTNNTGWGIGSGILYGGARTRSDVHPVKVRAHYRAAWGSKNGRSQAAVAVAQAVADEIGASSSVRRKLKKRKKFLRRMLPSATETFLMNAIRGRRRKQRMHSSSSSETSIVVKRVPKKRSRRGGKKRSSRGVNNVYLIRGPDGKRVPTSLRAHPSIVKSVRPHPSLVIETPAAEAAPAAVNE